jgi:hypothetical protein
MPTRRAIGTRRAATRTFLAVMNASEFVPWTAQKFTNVETPLIIAVERTRSRPGAIRRPDRIGFEGWAMVSPFYFGFADALFRIKSMRYQL